MLQPSRKLGPGDSTSPLILLAEDYEDAQDIYSTYLRLHGYRVALAATGPEAITLAHAETPAMILLDIRMPGMTGTEVMQILRTDAKFAAVPIFALTAHALEDEHAAALSAGFDQVISKPCLPDELLRSVQSTLARVRTEQ
ncbi:MAG TPA: response regulator [Vicinamibacterales bacterium]|nr:response regulator [Vicinamibacterales bacterium]